MNKVLFRVRLSNVAFVKGTDEDIDDDADQAAFAKS